MTKTIFRSTFLVGLLVLAFFPTAIPVDYRDDAHSGLPHSHLFFSSKMKGAVTLGRYIILRDAYFKDWDTWNHERGHSIQSMILGPLYLPVIGIPSLAWATLWYFGIVDDRKASYYAFYTEKWADRLGGVKR